MWDIISYNHAQLSFALRKGRQGYVFSYPWDSPKPAHTDTEGRAEEINVPPERLLNELRARAQVHALDRVSRIARAQLGGKAPKTLEDLHKNALKFAFRRLRAGQSTGQAFLYDLQCCAITLPIPEPFWNALSSFIGEEPTNKVRGDVAKLLALNGNPDQWAPEAISYLSRALWMKDEFDLINIVSTQLSILTPPLARKAEYAELARKSGGLLKAKEVEEEMKVMKPWQRGIGGFKKSVKGGLKASAKRPDRAQKKSSEETD